MPSFPLRFNMSSYRLISRTDIVLVGLFFMMAVSLGQDSSICSSWESDHDSENNLDHSIILWEKNERPFIDCALYCGMDSSCMSFFYHPSLEKCLGSQSYKRGLPDNEAVQQGWNYYTRPQHCDGDYIYNETLAVCYKLHDQISVNCSYAMEVCETEEAKLLILSNDDQLHYFSNILSGNAMLTGLRKPINSTVWWWWNGQALSNNSVIYDDILHTSYTLCASVYDGRYWIEDPESELYFLCQRHI